VSITLILGGARSGKSKRAEQLAAASDLAVTYIATAPHIEGDAAWEARIAYHRQSRPSHWDTLEVPLELCRILPQTAVAGRVVLVDCLTLWLSNLLHAGRCVETEVETLCALLPALPGEVVLVANEVGMGLVPVSKIGRAFRDAHGRLNQAVAAVAARVEFMAAGLPMILKGDSA